ncbi:MAG TPA: ribonuclease Y [bacterium]|nr:ribonuclease Y [bacterium]
MLAAALFVVGQSMGAAKARGEAESKLGEIKVDTEKIVAEARKEAETKAKEIIIEARDEAQQLVKNADKENRKKQSDFDKLQNRLNQKEESLDKKLEQIEKKEEDIKDREKKISASEQEIEKKLQEQREKLQQISGLSAEEARAHLLGILDKDLKKEYANAIKDYGDKLKIEAKRRSQQIISMAIQRCAVDHVAESTVSVVPLSSDDMKGRIIGREGRNIRSFETLTGVDLVVDDTPEAVVISSFDPIRREIARRSLEKLVADGRIHPARIEEVIEKTRADLESDIVQEGERVAFETKMTDLHPELIKLLGRLKFRTSYGQNVLNHSIEVAHLAASMAADLDVSVPLARRGGLLHDIGKAVDFEVEGPHALIGADLAKRYRETKGIIHIIASHHMDIEQQTIEAILVQVADGISGSRPGARREDLESYITRLTKLEDLALEFEGVDRAFAIQAGREIRVMVKPDRIDDDEAILLARNIAKKIESDLSYPGQIKINVLRETRAIDYAK